MRGVIYCYTLSGKKYVGKTITEERKRIDKHKFDALTKKANTPFARAIRKYGWENARKSYEVLEEVFADTKESLQSILCQKEEEWIEKMGSLVPNGYNVYKKGQDHLLCAKNKEEMYRKISVSLKGKYMNQEATSRKIYCVEQDKWYPSISEAERINGIARGCIGKAASGINCKAGGLTWSYDGSNSNREDLIKKSRKPVLCIETGIVYDSIYAAAKALYGKDASVRKTGIQAAIKRNGTACGYHFKFYAS